MKTPIDSMKKSVLCACPDVPVLLDGFVSVDYDRTVPPELLDELIDHFKVELGTGYTIRIQPRIAYSFLGSFEPDLALTLMNYGFTSVYDAMDFLDWCDYGWLRNASWLSDAKFACANGIPVETFLDAQYTNLQGFHQRHFLKEALDTVSKLDPLRANHELACDIASDRISTVHIEEVGHGLIANCSDSEYLRTALSTIKSNGTYKAETDYTTDDLRAILTKCDGDRQEMIRRLKLLTCFDAKTAMSVKYYGFISNITAGPRPQAQYSSAFILYADSLYGAARKVRSEDDTTPIQQRLTLRLMSPLFEEKVDVDFAAPLIFKGETTDRIIAMHAGVHNVMTEGWL